MAKDSILAGAAESAPVRSQKNSAPPNTKQAKGYSGPLNAVVYTATNRQPKKVDATGESNVRYVKELKNTKLEGNH